MSSTWTITRRLAVALVTVAAGCGDADDGGAFVDHDEDADFEPFDAAKADGVASTFNRHDVVDDAFFTAADAVDAATVQAFFEHTPYGKRCFLADATAGSRTAAQAIVEAAQEHGINPILLLSRMQVEKGLVSKSVAPSQHTIDFAFGCGCADGHACSPAFRGFDKQVQCAAETMREHFDAASTGSGLWRVGVGKKSLDGLTVTPANAATASLYAYTPWVLTGRGGNWLVWNVTGKYVDYLAQTGDLDLPTPSFVGTPCTADDADACGFSHSGDEGFCDVWQREGEDFGACTLECEGTCPDKSGTLAGDTLCVEVTAGVGHCLPVAAADNDDCAKIPGTIATAADRFIGTSSSGPRNATVCMPDAQATAPSGGPSCVDHCGEGTAQPDGMGNACFCDDACTANGDCCEDFPTVCTG